MDFEKLFEEVVEKRVDEILRAKNDERIKMDEIMEEVLSGLEKPIKKKFELFADNLFNDICEDYSRIYQTGFLDGLKIAHKAF